MDLGGSADRIRFVIRDRDIPYPPEAVDLDAARVRKPGRVGGFAARSVRRSGRLIF
jgi:hypothetical protein